MADRDEPEDLRGPAPNAHSTAELPRVFISYASDDKVTADAVCAALEHAGIPCWIAPRDIKPGGLYADAIVRAITNAKDLVLVLSESSIASSHVGKEIERASSKKRPIIALRIDNAPLTPALEYFLSESQWIEAKSENRESAYARLIDAIQEPERTAPRINPAVTPQIGAAPALHSGGLDKRVLNATILTVIALVAALLAGKFWLGAHIRAEKAEVAAAYIVNDKSIAVLPFADMSEKKDQEYFADGMAEEILDILAKIPQLRVLGRTSSFQFKGRAEDLRMVGEKLGAAYVVEGSIRKAGGRVRVTAQLVDTKSGAHVWSETYDRNFGDVLALQDEIATAIARALQVTIDAHNTRPLRDERAKEAYALYLKGKVALDSFNKNSLAEAQSAFQQALALDPTLLGAAEGMALTWMQRGINENDITALEAWDQARAAAEKARSMEGTSVTAHAVLGFVAAMRDFDWATADIEFRAALATNPNNQTAVLNSAEILAVRGHFDEAIERLNASLVLDPLNSFSLQTLGVVLYLNRDHVAAASALRKSLAINPKIDYNHYLIGVIQLLNGRREEAIKEFLAEEEPTNRNAGLALINYAIGKLGIRCRSQPLD